MTRAELFGPEFCVTRGQDHSRPSASIQWLDSGSSAGQQYRSYAYEQQPEKLMIVLN